MQTLYYTLEPVKPKPPMSKLEQLQARMNELTILINKKRDDFMNSEDDKGDEDSFNAYIAVAENEEKEYRKLSRQYRVLVDPILSEWDETGDMMTLNNFEAYCKGGGFIDYDGHGMYSDGEKESDIIIYPSDIKAGNYRKDFTHVIWYNR